MAPTTTITPAVAAAAVAASPNEQQASRKRNKRRKRRTLKNKNHRKKIKESSSHDDSSENQTLIFQDVLKRYLDDSQQSTVNSDDEQSSEYEDAVSLAFFELANASEFAYRLADHNNNNKDSERRMLRFYQDTTAHGQHTGGIVWETSVLLLHFLLLGQKQQQQQEHLGRVLEVGAGCGFLGQALAAMSSTRRRGGASMHEEDSSAFSSSPRTSCSSHSANLVDCVVQTETSQVLVNLERNLQRNFGGTMTSAPPLDDDISIIRCCALDWTRHQQDAQAAHLAPHSFDTILGTDVIFTPELVQPLLETLDHLAAIVGADQGATKKHQQKRNDTKKQRQPAMNSTTIPAAVVYICVQVRCATSHAQFLKQAPEYFTKVLDWTEKLGQHASTEWGLAMDCHLYRLER